LEHHGQKNIGKSQAVEKGKEPIVEKARAMDKGKEPTMEHFHTLEAWRIFFLWGDQPILKPIDEVDDIESISYDHKRQYIVKRTQRKQKISVDNVVVVYI
jgi:hypothetical protein